MRKYNDLIKIDTHEIYVDTSCHSGCRAWDTKDGGMYTLDKFVYGNFGRNVSHNRAKIEKGKYTLDVENVDEEKKKSEIKDNDGDNSY